MKNGLLIVNKPAGYTSRDIVNIISKKLNTKKVGHTGTLDPIASGVLVVTVGRYTKLGNMLTALDKEYIAEIKLGIKTDTLDITGKTVEEKSYSHLNKEKIENTLKSFIGPYQMEVPIYSAIKVNGKKLYEYARNNESVKLPVKNVKIEELELLDFQNDTIKIRAKVEKGTYIRSLIRDICEELDTVGTMQSLTRTKQGNFKLNDAITIEDINNNSNLLKISDVLNIPKYNLNLFEYQKIINGNSIKLKSQEEQLLLIYETEEIAIYDKQNDIYIPNVMLKIKDFT